MGNFNPALIAQLLAQAEPTNPAVILGETLIGTRTVWRQVLAPVIGSLVYYQVISAALAVGLRPSDLKFITGLLVLLTLAIPAIRGAGDGGLRMRE
ncbi:MAG: hypothetical protein EXR27_05775 [Betaproteobacteria bacterium]|nr:hypothetical protein [Betaproteobacteria bacterium]